MLVREMLNDLIQVSGKWSENHLWGPMSQCCKAALGTAFVLEEREKNGKDAAISRYSSAEPRSAQFCAVFQLFMFVAALLGVSCLNSSESL